MKQVTKIAATLASLMISFSASANGFLDNGALNGDETLNQRPFTMVMGSAYLTDRQDVDVLNFKSCVISRNERVYGMKLKVTKYPAEIDRVELTYANGDKEVLPVRRHFAAGSESVWFNISGLNRCIKKIKVWGDAETLLNAPLRQSKVTFIGLTF